jgi:hypothetical protein
MEYLEMKIQLNYCAKEEVEQHALKYRTTAENLL